MLKSDEQSQQAWVLICAPFGRDGELIHKELAAAGIPAQVCPSIEQLSAEISADTGAALIGDEALVPQAVRRLAGELSKQPQWSDFPLVIMTSGGETTQGSRNRLRLLEPLGNVTLLERPLRSATLVSSLRAVLRARAHQYRIAALLKQMAAAECEIRKQNDDLLKANRELEEFAYVVSHDLQEPLRMINIYTQLLLKRVDREDPKNKEFAEFINTGVTRMSNLLHDLVSFSRTIHPDSSAVRKADLSVSLANALTMLNGQIQETHATVQCGSLPLVRGDEKQLTHVFQNLISNSLKYRRPDRDPAVCISAQREGTEWKISVRDNGIGFDSQYADRIFGLFKRLHREEYPGTGLGLAISKRIVERCGGRIWAESNPGEGAAFHFTLESVSEGECGER